MIGMSMITNQNGGKNFVKQNAHVFSEINFWSISLVRILVWLKKPVFFLKLQSSWQTREKLDYLVHTLGCTWLTQEQYNSTISGRKWDIEKEALENFINDLQSDGLNQRIETHFFE